MSQRRAERESSETSASRRQRPGTVLYGKTNNYEQARDDNDILGRDPAGPLAPLGGAEPLLQWCGMVTISMGPQVYYQLYWTIGGC